MKDTTKRTVRNLFASLIKNDSAIDGAKTAPWWIAVILFIVGTFLPIIPIMTNVSKTYGAEYISGNVYGYEQGLAWCGQELKYERGYSFTVEDGTLVARKKTNPLDPEDAGEVINQTWVEVDGVSPDETPISVYYTHKEGVAQRSLEIYYSDRPYNSTSKSITALRKVLDNRKYLVGTETVYNVDEHGKDASVYIPSYLILYKTGMVSRIFKTNTATQGSITYGGMDWKNAKFTELLDYLLTVDSVEPKLTDANYVNGVLENLKTVANDAYRNQKRKTFWFQSGLYYGIYLVLGLFMGLMMWLLTRGKRNPNRNLTIFVGFKISWWIDFTPGLLAMILGFIWAQAAGLAYIVLIGLRTMWLSMRSLNPVPAQ